MPDDTPSEDVNVIETATAVDPATVLADMARESPYKVQAFSETRIDKYVDGKWVKVDGSKPLDEQINAWVEKTKSQITFIDLFSVGIKESTHTTRYSVHNAIIVHTSVENWARMTVQTMIGAITSILPKHVGDAFVTAVAQGAKEELHLELDQDRLDAIAKEVLGAAAIATSSEADSE